MDSTPQHAQLPSSKGVVRSFMIAASLVPIFFLFGTEIGQSAGMLPQLMDENSLIKINMDDATWIASTPMIGTLLASFFGGLLSDKFGRIRLGQAGYLFFFAGFVTMLRADGFKALVLGRFLTGLGGGCTPNVGIYISEIAPPAYRGILVSLGSLMTALGTAFMFLVGGSLPWKIGAGITSIISVFGFILTFFFYESPVWLVRKDKINAARKSLERIGGPANVNDRLRELLENTDSQPETKFNLKVFKEPSVWRPYAILLCLSFLQNASGYFIAFSYTVHIVKGFQTTYDPLHVTVAVGVIKPVAMMLSSYLLRRIGRKPLGALSGFSSTVILLCIFAYLQFADKVGYLRENSWIPIALFLMFIMTTTLGIYPLPFAMMYELFPISVRGMITGICHCSMNVMTFISIKSYNVLLVYFQLNGIVLLFAVSSFLFGLFSTVILVETHKKTLDEIEAFFAGREQRCDESERVNLAQNTPSEILLGSPVLPSDGSEKSTNKSVIRHLDIHLLET